MINTLSDRLAARLPFFYGYVMMPVAMMLQICTSPGQTFAVSAFTPALRDSLSLSESRLSLAYMLGTFLAAFPLSAIGPISDRWGLRRVSFVAVVGLAGACYLASRATGFLTLLLAFLLLRFLGQGSLSLLSGNTISMWFRSRIGRVSAVMSIGMALAFAWVPEWLSESIATYGWRETYQGIAVVILAVMVPLLLLLFRNRPEDLGQSVDGRPATMLPPDPTDNFSSERRAAASLGSAKSVHQVAEEYSLSLREAVRGRSYYILAAATAFWALTGTGVIFHLFTLCADRGMSEDLPADLFKTFGLMMLTMQLFGGVLSDFLPLNRLLGLGVSLLCTGLGILFVAETATAFHLFSLFFGGGQGLLISVGAVVWVRYYGRSHLGSIRGSVWSLTVAGSGCGPLVMGVIKDTTGSFDGAIGLFFAGMLPLALGGWLATPPQRENETPEWSEAS